MTLIDAGATGAPDSNASIESRAGNLFAPGGVLGPEIKEQPPQPVKQQPRQQEQRQEQQAEPEQNAEPVAEQEAAPEGEQAPVEETFEFDIDGEKFLLPKKLEKAVMQNRDYTQKTQTLSQREKQIEVIQEQARIAAFRQEFEKEAGPDMQRLAAYDAVLSQPVDWSSLTSDQKFDRMALEKQWERERDALRLQIQTKHQQWAQKTEDALKTLREKATETVRQRIPNWNDDAWKAVRDHAKQDGYSDQELNFIHDPRHQITLWKAQQFDQLKAKSAKAVVDVKSVKTTSSNPMPQSVKDKLAFNKVLQRTAPNSPERVRAVEQRAGSLFSKR